MRRLVLATLLLTGCDLPTGPPHWTTDWAIPVGPAVVPVTSFLPKGVTLTPDSTAFLLRLGGSRISARLGSGCALCDLISIPAVVPKPAFVLRLAARAPLPSELVSALVLTPALPIEVVNGLNFDPIRPGPERGRLELAVRSRDAELGGMVVHGEESGLAPGDTFRLDLPIFGKIRDWLEIAAVLDSPAGDPVGVDSDLQVALALGASELHLLEAQVLLRDRRVASTPVRTRLSEVSPELLDRVEWGRIRVEVQNPFEVRGVFQARIEHDRGVLTRELILEPDQSRVDLELSGTELKEILSSGAISVAFDGLVNSGANGVTVRPDQRLVLRPRIYITLRMEL